MLEYTEDFGDDVHPNKLVLKAGRLSTGDELVSFEKKPAPGQVRDVNAPMLAAMLTVFGTEVTDYGIVTDDESLLDETMHKAAEECDAVLISGGSSVGMKDSTCTKQPYLPA